MTRAQPGPTSMSSSLGSVGMNGMGGHDTNNYMQHQQSMSLGSRQSGYATSSQQGGTSIVKTRY